MKLNTIFTDIETVLNSVDSVVLEEADRIIHAVERGVLHGWPEFRHIDFWISKQAKSPAIAQLARDSVPRAIRLISEGRFGWR